MPPSSATLRGYVPLLCRIELNRLSRIPRKTGGDLYHHHSTPSYLTPPLKASLSERGGVTPIRSPYTKAATSGAASLSDSKEYLSQLAASDFQRGDSKQQLTSGGGGGVDIKRPSSSLDVKPPTGRSSSRSSVGASPASAKSRSRFKVKAEFDGGLDLNGINVKEELPDHAAVLLHHQQQQQQQQYLTAATNSTSSAHMLHPTSANIGTVNSLISTPQTNGALDSAEVTKAKRKRSSSSSSNSNNNNKERVNKHRKLAKPEVRTQNFKAQEVP